MKRVWRWECVGVPFIFLFGFFLHFTFELLGSWRPAALVSAVNESTWEHFKIAFWPGLLFAVIEYRFLKESVQNFWLAKSLALLSVPVTIAVLFYGYTAVIGRHYLPVDILIFLVAVAVGQLLSYKLLLASEKGHYAERFGLVLLAFMALAFSLLTYYPPHMFLFENPRTEGYGIPEIM
jgi:hypothetical protein